MANSQPRTLYIKSFLVKIRKNPKVQVKPIVNVAVVAIKNKSLFLFFVWQNPGFWNKQKIKYLILPMVFHKQLQTVWTA